MDESNRGKPSDVDGMRAGSSDWSLGNDAEMLNYLMDYSQSLISNISEVQQQLNTVLHNSKLISMQVNSVFMEFIMLANTQFVENRVYDEDITNDKKEAEPEATSNKEKSKEEVEANVIPKISEALKLGLKVIDKAFEKIEIDDGASDGEDEATGFKPDPIFEAKDPYLNRPMPYLIGSAAFNQDDDVGLIDYISDEETKVEEEEASASESESSDTESQESDHDTTDNDSQSVSSQESDLFHSDDEKENNDLFSPAQSNQYEEPEIEQSISSQIKQKEGRDKKPGKQLDSNQGLVVKDLDNLFNTDRQSLDDNSSESDDHGLFSSKDKGDLFNDFEDEHEDTSVPFEPPKVVKPSKTSKENTPQVQKKKTKEFGAGLFGDSDDDLFSIGDKPSRVEGNNLFSGSNEDIFSLPSKPEQERISDYQQKGSDVHVESTEEPKNSSEKTESVQVKPEKRLPVGAVPLFGAGSNPIVKALKKRPDLFEDANEVGSGSPGSVRKSGGMDSASSEDELFKTENETNKTTEKVKVKVKDTQDLKFKSPLIRSDSLSSEDDLFKIKSDPSKANTQNVENVRKDDKFKAPSTLNISKVERSDSFSSEEDDLFSIRPNVVKSKQTSAENADKNDNKFKVSKQHPFPNTARSDSLSSEDDLFKIKPGTSKPEVKLSGNKNEKPKKGNLGLFFENNTEDADDLFSIKDELNAKLASKPARPTSKKPATTNAAPVPQSQPLNSSSQIFPASTKDKDLFSPETETKSDYRPVTESTQEKFENNPIQTLPSLTKSRARLPRNRRPPTRPGKQSKSSTMPGNGSDELPDVKDVNLSIDRSSSHTISSAEVSKRTDFEQTEVPKFDNTAKATSNVLGGISEESNLPIFVNANVTSSGFQKTSNTEQPSIISNGQSTDSKKKPDNDQDNSEQFLYGGSSIDSKPTASTAESDTTSKVQSWLDKSDPVIKQSGKSLFEEDEDDDIFASNLMGKQSVTTTNNDNDDIFSIPSGKLESKPSVLKAHTAPAPFQQNKPTDSHPVAAVKPGSGTKSRGNYEIDDDIFNVVPVQKSQKSNPPKPTNPLGLGNDEDDIFNVTPVKKTLEKTPVISRVVHDQGDDDDIFNAIPVKKPQDVKPPEQGLKSHPQSYQSPNFPKVAYKEEDDIFSTTPVKRPQQLKPPEPEVAKDQSKRKQPRTTIDEDDIFNVLENKSQKSKPAPQEMSKPDVVDLFDEGNIEENNKSLGNVLDDETGDDIFSDVPSQPKSKVEEASDNNPSSHNSKRSKKRHAKPVKDEDIFKDDIDIFADFQENSGKKEKTVKPKKVNRKKVTQVTEEIDDIFGTDTKTSKEKMKKTQSEKFKDPLNVFDD